MTDDEVKQKLQELAKRDQLWLMPGAKQELQLMLAHDLPLVSNTAAYVEKFMDNWRGKVKAFGPLAQQTMGPETEH